MPKFTYKRRSGVDMISDGSLKIIDNVMKSKEYSLQKKAHLLSLITKIIDVLDDVSSEAPDCAYFYTYKILEKSS